MNISNNSDSTAKNQIALENQLKSQENIFKEIISKIKEDYENIISKKDLEVKAYVSQLADENSKLKADSQIQKEKNVLLTNKLDVIKQTYSSLALVNNKEENNTLNNLNIKKIDNAKCQMNSLDKNYMNEISVIKEEFVKILNKYSIITPETINIHFASEEKIENFLLETQNIISSYQKTILNLYENIHEKDKLAINLSLSIDSLKDENLYITNKLVQEKIKIINQLNEQREKNRNDIITQKKLFINDKLLKDNEEIKKLFTTLGYNNNQQNVIDTLKIEKEKINQQNFQMLNKITEINEHNQILQGQIEVLQKTNDEYSNEKNKIEKEIDEYRKQIDTYLEEIESLKIQIQVMNKNYNDKENELSVLITKTKLKEVSYQNEINMISVKLSNTIKEFNSLLDEKDRIINELTNENVELKDLNEHLNDLITEKEAELNKGKNEIIGIKGEKYNLELKLTAQNEVISLLEQSKSKLEEVKSELINTVSLNQKEIDQLNKKNNGLLEENDFLKKENDKLSKNLLEIIDKKDTITNQNVKLQNELNTLKNNTLTEKEKYISYDSKLATYENENNTLKKKYDIIVNENQEIKVLINSLFDKFTADDTSIPKEIKQSKEPILKLKEVYNSIDNLSSLTNNLKVSNDKIIQYENEISKLKTRINSLLTLASGNVTRINVSKLPNSVTNKISQNQLYERIIKYIKDLNISHEIQICRMTIQFEEQQSNKNYNELEKSITSIEQKHKENTEQFEKRLKQYISISDIKEKVTEIQSKYEAIIGSLFEKFISYNVVKENNNPFILLKIPVNEYNEIIENSMKCIEETVNYILSFYSEISLQYDANVESAFDAIINLTLIKNDFTNSNSSRAGW